MDLWSQMSGKMKVGLLAVGLALFAGLAFWGVQMGAERGRVSVSVDEAVREEGEGAATPRIESINVYVSGAVRRPGVYHLGSDRLVQDAIYLAGGAVEGADLDRVNLAGRMVDGMQIHVPWRLGFGEPAGTEPEMPTVVSINLGTKEQLMTLPGIGEKTAEAIIEERTKNGPFERMEDLVRVDGIGEGTLEKLVGLVSL